MPFEILKQSGAGGAGERGEYKEVGCVSWVATARPQTAFYCLDYSGRQPMGSKAGEYQGFPGG
jgi:hypothetical protein